MILSLITVGAATAAKWLVAAKVMTAVGTGFIIAAPAVEKIKNKR